MFHNISHRLSKTNKYRNFAFYYNKSNFKSYTFKFIYTYVIIKRIKNNVRLVHYSFLSIKRFIRKIIKLTVKYFKNHKNKHYDVTYEF